MKRLVLGMLGLVLLSSLALAQEVSDKKDLGITKVFSPRNVPEPALTYFDEQIISTFSDMARFNVVGYQFRLDESSATKLIEKIQELKQNEVMTSEEYVDEDLGIVVLSTTELEALVSAFFVIIPEFKEWSVKTEKKEIQVLENGIMKKKMVDNHIASISVSVKVITSDGDLMETYTGSAEEESTESMEAAWKTAIATAISGLELWLRQTDEFKLKTAVRGELGGGMVMIELGKDLGVEPGYEFVIQREIALSGGFSTKVVDGLVRVKTVYDNASEAKVLWGSAPVDTQLVESALAGARGSVYAGILYMTSELNSIAFSVGGYSWSKTNFNFSQIGIDLGIAGESEMGYNGLAKAAIGVVINDPLAAYLDLGYGYEMYLGRLSIVPELSLSVLGSFIDMGEATYLTKNAGAVPGHINIIGWYLGAKPKLSFNLQFSQNFKLKLFAGYSYYIGLATTATFNPNDSSIQSEAVTDMGSISVNGTSTSSLASALGYNGVNAGVEFIFRF